ncbi:TetR/AcrR family transcriptional regulator [Streptomyces sp. NPDC056883]|uniref:TetR/AcrR family transcriptional regulator n=1 Tax=Streptomyces sp. NPDC056883 TaxID=3345959 RepID=UPI0036BC0FFC
MRLSAEDRRTAVVRIALSEFARYGLHGTSTQAIARGAGVSQPYLFRLFANKKALFRATARHCFDRTVETFETAAGDLTGPAAVRAVQRAWEVQRASGELPMMQMQLYAAAYSDPEIRDEVVSGWERLWATAIRVTGMSTPEVARLFSRMMLINSMVSLAIPPEHRGWSALAGPADDEAPGACSRSPKAAVR